MSYKIKLENNQLNIIEQFGRPIVYLDQWALKEIALAVNNRDRFISAMVKRRSTLRVSIQNIAELIKQGDTTQRKKILDMIDSVNSGLIDVDPKIVIERENELIKNPTGKPNNPSLEIDLIEAYLHTKNLPPMFEISDIRISEIISIAVEGFHIQKLKDKDTAFAEKMKKTLDLGRKDSNILKKAKKRFNKIKVRGKKYPTATRELNQMVYDFIVMNQTMRMAKASEWNDLLHVVVPVSYCDIVLIDRRWTAFISQTGFKFPAIAVVFDKRSIEEFFRKLETNEFNQIDVNR